MIVKDRQTTIQNADEFSKQVMVSMLNVLKATETDDYPGEHIYFMAHLAGRLLARICVIIEEYGKIYNIENMTRKEAETWINFIAKETMYVIDYSVNLGKPSGEPN